MTTRIALISGAVLGLGLGAAQAGEFYGGAAAMGPVELGQATGTFALADSFAGAGNWNDTLQLNAQGAGILFGVGECVVCTSSSANQTSQRATANSTSTATETNLSMDNINIGFSGNQGAF